MFIYYYNSKGELMNNQFIGNGQDKIHQHFFTPENVKPTFDGQPEADDNDPQISGLSLCRYYTLGQD